MARRTKNHERPDLLKGWKEIANFLGQPVSVAQRWAKSGMPVAREGRRVHASIDELNHWMQRETSEPVQIASNATDLGAELKRGLSFIRKQGEKNSKKKVA
jgi:hypothetical protein